MPLTEDSLRSEINELKAHIRNLESIIARINVKINTPISSSTTSDEHPTISSIRLDIPGTRIYDTIVLKDADTTLDSFDYREQYNYGCVFNLLTMRTQKFVYTHTGIVSDRFFIQRYHQTIDNDNVSITGPAMDTFYDFGTYVFESLYLRGTSNNDMIPPYPLFECTAFYPLITDN